MGKHFTISTSVSPLLWLAPLPFVLAMCLPLDLPRADPDAGRCRTRRGGAGAGAAVQRRRLGGVAVASLKRRQARAASTSR